MRKEHLTKHPLDDEIAQRTVAQFVKMLDPMKVYFYQSDVDTFTAEPRGRKPKKGDISLGYVMFKTFLARMDERVKLVDELLAAKHDFTVDEEILIDRDEARSPRRRTRPRSDGGSGSSTTSWSQGRSTGEGQESQRTKKKEDAKSPSDEGPEEEADARAGEAKEVGWTGSHGGTENFAKRMHQTTSDELLEMYLPR